jgi:hypothetical protein
VFERLRALAMRRGITVEELIVEVLERWVLAAEGDEDDSAD